MPAERRKKTQIPERVPTAGDPDRKRVLNVLAQRRYRQKRREKIAALEAQARGLTLAQSSDENHETHNGGTTPPEPNQNSRPSSWSVQEEDVVEDVIRQSDMIEFPEVDFGQNPIDMQLFGDFNLSHLPTPIPGSPTSTSSNPAQGSSSGSSHSFPLSPDGAQISVPILSSIRAFTTIAIALDLLNNLWDPNYMHTLAPNSFSHLPPNLRPTPAQMSIPHHPMLDGLPWPSVREKLICILALPSALRPPVAQDEHGASQGQGKAVMRLVQDLDDFKEGLKVHGNMSGWGKESELEEEAWEIGECFYRNWWWCLDEKVVKIANRRRRQRGEEALKIESS